MFDLDTMRKTQMRILAAMSLVMASSVASAQTPTSRAELVTVENYNRAQTDVYFAGVVKNGGFGKFWHRRELAPPAQQGSIGPIIASATVAAIGNGAAFARG